MSLLNLLYDSIRKKQEQEYENRKEKTYFNVTEAHACPRALYYAWKGEKRLTYDGNTMLKFKVGDKMHQLIVSELMNAEGIRVVAAEVDIPSEKHDGLFHGRADVIVCTKEENELRVVDIKTISNYGFKLLQEGKDSKEEHITQVQFYMHYFNINKGSILYFNKDTQEMLEIEVERDDDKVLKIIEQFKELKKQFENGIIPMPDKSQWKYNKCTYCPYRTICDVVS